MKNGAGGWRLGVGRSLVAGVAVVVVAALPSAVLACPVCFSNGNPRVLEAYYISVAFMSALPLALIAGVGWWLYTSARRARDLGAGDQGLRAGQSWDRTDPNPLASPQSPAPGP